ncbi:hypothetical protein D3C79_779660 [compost metagenome]
MPYGATFVQGIHTRVCAVSVRFADRAVFDTQSNRAFGFGQPGYAMEGVGVGTADQRNPFSRAARGLVCLDDQVCMEVHHALACHIGNGICPRLAVTGHAVDGLYAYAVFLCADQYLPKGVAALGVGAVADILAFHVAIQLLRHHAGAVEGIQVCLLEVGGEVLHVQRLYLQFA